MDWLKLVIRKLRRFRELDGNSRWLLLESFFWLSLVSLSLKYYGVKSTQASLVRLLPSAKLPVEKKDRHTKIVTTIKMVQLSAKYCQPWAKCLQKSLVLWSLLRRQSIDSDLRIGVQLDKGEFEAHAWVECEGYVLNDTQDVRDRFAVFDRPIDLNLFSES